MIACDLGAMLTRAVSDSNRRRTGSARVGMLSRAGYAHRMPTAADMAAGESERFTAAVSMAPRIAPSSFREEVP
jgi:hypothetical protein